MHYKFKRVALRPTGHLRPFAKKVVSTPRRVVLTSRVDSTESSITLQITKINNFQLITCKVAYTSLLFQLTISRRRLGDYKLTYSLSHEFSGKYYEFKP